MPLEYSSLKSLTKEEFDKRRTHLNEANATKSDAADIRKIEEFLEVRHETFAEEELFVAKMNCKCGRALTFFDVVKSAVEKGGHTKSFMVHMFVGEKFIVGEPQPFVCSDCGSALQASGVEICGEYDRDGYGCSFCIPVVTR